MYQFWKEIFKTKILRICISEELLRLIGAKEQYCSAGDYLFRQDTLPQFYFYIMEGRIKLNKYAEDGKEFIQDIIDRKSGAGESILVLGKPYPVNAVALSECTVLKVAGTQFFTLLRDQPSFFRDIYSRLADSTFEKQTLIHTITSRTAEDTLIEILNLMKESQEKKISFPWKSIIPGSSLPRSADYPLKPPYASSRKWRRRIS